MKLNEQKRVERIRAKYAERKPTDLDALCELDTRVERPVSIFAYSYGSAGSLVLGTGMCLAMKVIGSAVLPGVAIGSVGIAMVSSTYALYRRLLKERRAKYKDEVEALCHKVLEESK